ncbi:Glutamate-rich WD repeat-containing protein 1 [Armadillidium vulgare]|nr:Glutamate-rich WD repeat-containing protein 1 [Armadillidium vulgare]
MLKDPVLSPSSKELKIRKIMEVDEHEEDLQEQNEFKSDLECDLQHILFPKEAQDDLGEDRNLDHPLTCYFVAGSQAERTHLNKLVLLKSVTLNDKKLAATWSELGQVNIWDLSPMLEAVEKVEEEDSTQVNVNTSPLFTFNDHGIEGFALDWSPTLPGTLATGDCSKFIFVWQPLEGGLWSVSKSPYTAHTASVEDIQWSPNEPHVFASCSVDKSVRIWDARAKPNSACMLTCANAHESDVNVIHWNRNDPFIASGGDDCKLLVWDLRKFETNMPVAHLQYHSKPICTVEWHPTDSSVLASGGEDDCVLQWDLAVERDDETGDDTEDKEIPEQLLFIHQGQKEVKEVHWHPQVPGIILSTALSGFNIFKTISC